MTSEWKNTTLGEICKFIAGSAFKNEYQGTLEGDFPFIKVSDMNLAGNEIYIRTAQNYISESVREKLEAKLHKTGATVFAKIGVALQSNRRRLLVKPTIIDNNMMSANPAEGIVRSRYLYFLLSTIDFNTIASGSALPYLNVSDLQKISISLPRDLREQEEIESFLGALDDRITLLRETNKTLESIAQAIFKSWFIDFDPVRAKIEGRVPAGMDEETAALFPDELVESELGLIPKGWKIGIVKDLGEVVCGKTPSTSVQEYFGHEVPFITIPDMHNNLVITHASRALSLAGANSQSNKTLPPGSVCVSCIATPGLVARVSVASQTNQQINSVIPFKKWGDSFVLFALRRIGEAVRTGGSGGSVFHNLNKSGFERLTQLLPDEKLTNSFNKIAECLVSKIICNRYQEQSLSEIRDTLLPRLISGKLRLADPLAKVS